MVKLTTVVESTPNAAQLSTTILLILSMYFHNGFTREYYITIIGSTAIYKIFLGYQVLVRSSIVKDFLYVTMHVTIRLHAPEFLQYSNFDKKYYWQRPFRLNVSLILKIPTY